MGMDVYAYGSFDGTKEICMMCWRKPYAFEAWLRRSLPDVGHRRSSEGYSVELTAALFAMAENMAEIDAESGEGDFWHQWTDTNFNWRAMLALKAGARVTVFVSP